MPCEEDKSLCKKFHNGTDINQDWQIYEVGFPYATLLLEKIKERLAINKNH